MKYKIKHLDALSKAMEEIMTIEKGIIIENDDDKQEVKNLKEVWRNLYQIYNTLEV